MGGLSSAVHWWEDWQMRLLVLSSLVIQLLLLIFSYLRRFAISRWFRSIMWLAYLASDSVAIYALATLFNRHKDQQDRGASVLEVVWAPVLLIHLGGHDGVTAFNIEDNELWSRHLLTAVSQVTVAIYVFCKSWPGGDKKLLQAVALLFVPGIFKCFMKPLILMRASIINSLVSLPAAERRTRKPNQGNNMHPLEEYVEEAKAFVRGYTSSGAQEARAQVEVEDRRHAKGVKQNDGEMYVLDKYVERAFRGKQYDKEEDISSSQNPGRKGDEARVSVEEGGGHPPSQQGRDINSTKDHRQRPREKNGDQDRDKRESILRSEAFKLFVDLSSPYPHRVSILKYFWVLSKESREEAYASIRRGLASAFLLLYTNEKTSLLGGGTGICIVDWSQSWGQLSRMVLPWAAIGLFHHRHREAYDDIDVKITYAIFCCTAVLELYSCHQDQVLSLRRDKWPEMVSQYSLIGHVARNKNHSKVMWILSKVGCKNLLEHHWCMSSCFSSSRITMLVLQYLKAGWEKGIHDPASYRTFNDNRGHWALEGNTKDQLGWSIQGPFDESVVLWHIATDICFFLSPFSDHICKSAHLPAQKQSGRKSRNMYECEGRLPACKAVNSRQMSNYMMYLLFVNPEMLLPGTRQKLFTTASNELQDILGPRLLATAYKKLKDIIRDKERSMCTRVMATIKEIKDILWDKKRNPLSWSQLFPTPVKDEELMERVISTMLDKSKNASKQQSEKCSEEESKEGPKKEPNGGSIEKLVDDAWDLAQGLLGLGDDETIWKVIEGVWVEMLCFSASRCRGYLHAKALGSGGEFLSYIWLLQFYMGTETLTERLQREELIASPPRREEGLVVVLPSWQGNNKFAAPSTSYTRDASSTSNTSTFPSTSEIQIAGEDMV